MKKLEEKCPYYEFIEVKEEGELDIYHCNYPCEWNDGDCVGFDDISCPLEKRERKKILRKNKILGEIIKLCLK